MKIDRLVMDNFCQHPSVDVALGTGVVGIMGANGCGKSNLIKGILRGLTGSSGNFGKKEDDLRYGADKGFLQVYFSVGQQKGVIKRHLKTTACNMKFGDKDYRTATEIDEVIYGILGVPAKVLTDMIFVQQGALEGVLFQRPAERAKAFQVLFGTDSAEPIRELLAETITRLVPGERSDMIEHLETQLKAVVRPQLTAVRNDLASVRPLPDDQFKAYTATVLRFDQQQVLAQTLERATGAVKNLTAQITNDRAQLTAVLSNFTTYSNAVKSLSEDYASAIKRRDSYEATAMRARMRADFKRVIETSQRALAVPEPVKTIDTEKLAEDTQRLHQMQAELSVSRHLLNSIKDGWAQCPTCLQPVNADHLASHRKKVTDLSPQLDGLVLQVQQNTFKSREEHNHSSIWQESKRMAQVQLSEATVRLSALPDEPEPNAAQQQDDLTLISTFEQAQAGVRSATGTVEVLNSRIGLMEQQLTQAKMAVSDSHNLGKPVTEAEVTAAREALKAHNTSLLSAAKLTGRLGELETQERQMLEQIAKHQEDEKKLTPIRNFKVFLERARVLLHRDQLPAMVARAYLQAINAKINQYLAFFEARYTCSINVDLTMTCVFTNGYVAPAERLSGGQRVMLGVAFRMAVYDLFAANLGLLVLDEPTAYLDGDSVDGIFELLSKVKSHSRSAGLQIIVVTHEPKLAGVFDTVIKL